MPSHNASFQFACLACGLALAGQQAAAGLFVADFLIWTEASVQRNGETVDQAFERTTTFPLLPVNLRATASLGPNSVDARQSEGGVYSNRSVAAIPDFFSADSVSVTGSTQYRIVVASDAVGEPLLLDFTFLGSEVFGGALYGDGEVHVQTVNRIDAAFALPFVPISTLSPTWGFVDEVTLVHDGSGRFSGSHMEFDAQGIGTPTAAERYGYVEFESQGSITRPTFSGTLDFGTLDPFQLFVLEFHSTTSIDMSNLPYIGRARANVLDPFSLASPAGMRFELRGLELRMPDDDPGVPVPAPATAGVLALGLFAAAVPWARRRARRLAHAVTR